MYAGFGIVRRVVLFSFSQESVFGRGVELLYYNQVMTRCYPFKENTRRFCIMFRHAGVPRLSTQLLGGGQEGAGVREPPPKLRTSGHPRERSRGKAVPRQEHGETVWRLLLNRERRFRENGRVEEP